MIASAAADAATSATRVAPLIRGCSAPVAAEPSSRHASTDRDDCPDSSDRELWNDSAERFAIDDANEPNDANDHADPTERMEPADPIERIDSVEPMGQDRVAGPDRP